VTTTESLLRRIVLENAGGQKTAITLDQAARLLTLDNLAPGSGIQNLQTGQEIDAAYSNLLSQTDVSEETVSQEIGHWRTWIESGSGEALRIIAEKGFMMMAEPGGDGNTDQHINHYDTDKTLNRGDFESPDFNATSTHT
jgi:hypothetical protein